MASTLFAVALLASGLNSTVTATLAGQIVMEGFLHIKLKPWIRRLTTRALALLPVLFVIGLYGEGETGKLLILSQVVLSMQLPFAVIPLIKFVSDKKKMGALVIPTWLKTITWAIASVIVALNVKLLIETILP
ncbi:MAG: divalent metal cation transporter [Alphaproteobacteria bacterium]|nr:divalent metal cation transporter [Alphaproteobacteria bacterium]